MARKWSPVHIAAPVVAMLAFAGQALAINLDELERQGETYVVALYSGYHDEAKFLERNGEKGAAEFLRARAQAIESGSEVFPFHPMAFSEADNSEQAPLMGAYKETFALVGSEAASVAPIRIAAIQIAYETWLFTSDTLQTDLTPELAMARWQDALTRFIDWSEGTPEPMLSAMNAMAQTQSN